MLHRRRLDNYQMSLSPNNLESRQRELRDQEYDNAVMIDQIDERDGDNNNSPSDV